MGFIDVHKDNQRTRDMQNRREFLARAGGAAMGAALTGCVPLVANSSQTQAAVATRGSRPVVVASANGIRGVAVARRMIIENADPLDAIIAGVNIQELDPDDQSVGIGGFPNAEGVVQLDASVMHGPSRKAGAVAALEGIATPSLVAKAVMDHTDHILLAGEGAKRFAFKHGFKEVNLLTEKSRQAWLRWKACNGLAADNEVPYTTGTINMLGVTGAGDIASVTTTSGLSWKVPGRVGDSPIVGAGQYCDNTVGAAGSTGLGEANIKVCGAFLIVEFMRQGLSPEQACLKTIERVIAMTEAKRLDRGRPLFDLQFYAVNKDGAFGAAACYEGGRYAVADSEGARLMPFAFLIPRSDRPEMPSACRKAS